MPKAIRLAVTMGDPSGIGPEIIVKSALKLRKEIARRSDGTAGGRKCGRTDQGLRATECGSGFVAIEYDRCRAGSGRNCDRAGFARWR